MDTVQELKRGAGVRWRPDSLFRGVTGVFAALSVIVLAGMAIQMIKTAMPALRQFGWRFLSSREWDPVLDSFGALPYIYGTLASSFVALVLALPVALGAAIFLVEFTPNYLKRPLGMLIEMLAAIPSVIYGLWGLFVLVPWLRQTVQPLLAKYLGFLPFFQGPQMGFSLLAGGLMLSIMILPTIVSVSRDVLLAVPGNIREGALALGATRWEMVRKAVLPAAKSGIIGAIMLGLGRALGETMAVTMVIGNRSSMSLSLFDPAYSLASIIANEYAEASGELHLAALTEIGLILFGVTVLLNVGARLLMWRTGKRGA